jgi:ubiquinone/menaquinone biosynthesis C-methylase UbiE
MEKNLSTANSVYSGSVPLHYDKYQGPVFFEPYALEIAGRIDRSANVVLEIACGTGRVTRHLRNILSPACRLIATDLSPDMLAVAKDKLKDQAIEWQVADAQNLPFDDNSIDLIVCSFGYMFLPDKVKAFTEAFRALRHGGNLLFTTWDQLEHNGASFIQRKVSGKYLGDDLPETYKMAFAINNDDQIKDWLRRAGFTEIKIERVDKLATAASAKEVAEGLAQGGSMYNEIMKRNPDWVPQIKSEIEQELAENFGASPMVAPMRALVITARKTS